MMQSTTTTTSHEIIRRSLLGFSFLITLAIVLLGVAMGTANWLILSKRGYSTYFGLFEICKTNYPRCYMYADDDDGHHHDVESVVSVGRAARATNGAIIIYIISIVPMLFFSGKKHPRTNGYCTLIICLGGAIGAWIATGFFVADNSNLGYEYEHEQYTKNYGYSLRLCAASGLSALLAGICAAVAGENTHKNQLQVTGRVTQGQPTQRMFEMTEQPNYLRPVGHSFPSTSQVYLPVSLGVPPTPQSPRAMSQGNLPTPYANNLTGHFR